MSEAPSVKKEKRQKKRIVYVDENAPKRPLSAYVHFLNARRKELTDAGEHELVRQRTFLTQVGKEWKHLSEEQKKLFIDKAAEEQEAYNKAMGEYKKTEAYSQFQVRKEGLIKQRTLELKKKKNDVKCSDEVENNESDVVVANDVPIFSKEFLTFNKGQETKYKNLKKMVNSLQEEQDSLKLNISERILRGQQSTCAPWAKKIKQRWTKLLIDALAYVSVDGEYPTVQNIDTYMQKLKKLITEDPTNKDLIAVRMALSEVNFA
ncbi:unnamed protein product [Thelazia callipaeda]|uniref:HMG box domain-containing protein n=1 Tax=Thelazia callipaeda TaxID=103827 RepID=A0A0N5CKE6_THECL|nr:unnamed protein product [Thelazia callipaeda]